jgi:hypothetical protein
MNILTNFINGLRKSFDGKDYLREINQCKTCKNPAYTSVCLYCSTVSDYKAAEDKK